MQNPSNARTTSEPSITHYNLCSTYAFETGEYPWAMTSEWDNWDFMLDGSLGPIFDEDKIKEVLVCPKAVGEYGNWNPNIFTGYNYNCFSVGKCAGYPGKRTSPATEISDPANTALYGDAGYAQGHNKFIRAPKADQYFDNSGSAVRNAGTQSFRHKGACNIVFADGHVQSLKQSYRSDGGKGYVYGETKTGFISPDNSLYGGN